MTEPSDTTRKEVSEIKFLIHDLRVESFINEVIHYHVTVNTDLEIYSVDQAQAIHGEDLQELKNLAIQQRRALQEYTTAVKSFSPDQAILAAGRKYIRIIHEICELILNPRWGRASQVLPFLPDKTRSVRQHPHYMNCIRWISGVYSRIRHFLEESGQKDIAENFDVSEEVQDFVRTALYGYVTEKCSGRAQIQLDRLDPVVIHGNRWRFRRMFFNLVMNAVDAMAKNRVGVLNITVVKEAGSVVLRVRDNGAGMPPEKVEQLLSRSEALDGEVRSLGFVFVKQTLAEFGGSVTIDSKVGKGTTVMASIPYVEGAVADRREATEREDLEMLRDVDEARLQGRLIYARSAERAGDSNHHSCGELIHADYLISEAEHRGGIFAMGVTEENRIDFFTHRPYERDWNITHEELSPMFYEATIRGRLEDDEDQEHVLILKAPQNVREYFAFREVAEEERGMGTFVRLVHDEFIRIARKLIETGMPPQTGTHVTEPEKFFPEQDRLTTPGPFPLELLAGLPLDSEEALQRARDSHKTSGKSALTSSKEIDP